MWCSCHTRTRVIPLPETVDQIAVARSRTNPDGLARIVRSGAELPASSRCDLVLLVIRRRRSGCTRLPIARQLGCRAYESTTTRTRIERGETAAQSCKEEAKPGQVLGTTIRFHRQQTQTPVGKQWKEREKRGFFFSLRPPDPLCGGGDCADPGQTRGTDTGIYFQQTVEDADERTTREEELITGAGQRPCRHPEILDVWTVDATAAGRRPRRDVGRTAPAELATMAARPVFTRT